MGHRAIAETAGEELGNGGDAFLCGYRRVMKPVHPGENGLCRLGGPDLAPAAAFPCLAAGVAEDPEAGE